MYTVLYSCNCVDVFNVCVMGMLYVRACVVCESVCVLYVCKCVCCTGMCRSLHSKYMHYMWYMYVVCGACTYTCMCILCTMKSFHPLTLTPPQVTVYLQLPCACVWRVLGPHLPRGGWRYSPGGCGGLFAAATGPCLTLMWSAGDWGGREGGRGERGERGEGGKREERMGLNCVCIDLHVT